MLLATDGGLLLLFQVILMMRSLLSFGLGECRCCFNILLLFLLCLVLDCRSGISVSLYALV